MKEDQYPPGWNEARVRKVIAHYENQTDEAAAAEDDAFWQNSRKVTVEVPVALMPVLRELIGEYYAKNPRKKAVGTRRPALRRSKTAIAKVAK